MTVRHPRLAIAGVIVAAAMAVPAAALASGPGSPSGKPAPPQASAASAQEPAAARSQLDALAASAGISVSRLQAGLVAAKRAGGHTAGIAAFAAATGVSRATAQRVLYAVMGTSPSGKPAPPQASAASASKSAAARSQTVPAAVRALATRLGVSTSAAGRAFKQIAALSSTSGGAGPGSAAFAAIARDLGVSAARLAVAWDAVKPRVAGQ